ncbi:MAG: ferritin-like domain-containing protein, partial [Dolichospermum sp.]
MVQLTQRPITNKITNLQQKFIYEINTMFDAENRFLESQQMMWQCSQNNKFKMIIETHIQETEQHIKNLEQVLNILGEKPQRITCDV